jgi:hypothetical protein
MLVISDTMILSTHPLFIIDCEYFVYFQLMLLLLAAAIKRTRLRLTQLRDKKKVFRRDHSQSSLHSHSQSRWRRPLLELGYICSRWILMPHPHGTKGRHEVLVYHISDNYHNRKIKILRSYGKNKYQQQTEVNFVVVIILSCSFSYIHPTSFCIKLKPSQTYYYRRY